MPWNSLILQTSTAKTVVNRLKQMELKIVPAVAFLLKKSLVVTISHVDVKHIGVTNADYSVKRLPQHTIICAVCMVEFTTTKNLIIQTMSKPELTP